MLDSLADYKPLIILRAEAAAVLAGILDKARECPGGCRTTSRTVRVGDLLVLSRRVVYVVSHPDDPLDGYIVRSDCSQWCVNPAHLYKGDRTTCGREIRIEG